MQIFACLGLSANHACPGPGRAIDKMLSRQRMIAGVPSLSSITDSLFQAGFSLYHMIYIIQSMSCYFNYRSLREFARFAFWAPAPSASNLTGWPPSTALNPKPDPSPNKMIVLRLRGGLGAA